MAAQPVTRAQRRTLRYMAHCNVLQIWHKEQAEQRRKANAERLRLAAAISGLGLACIFTFAAITITGSTSGKLSADLAQVQGDIKALGAGAAEAGVQREHRTLLQDAKKNNARVINLLATTINEMPLGMFPEQVDVSVENGEITASGRATAFEGNVKFDFIRALENQRKDIDPKIDTFNLDEREGQAVERFGFIVRLLDRAPAPSGNQNPTPEGANP